MEIQNRRHDFNNDPYFYTGWNYRYYRGGRYCETNRYGANMLRQAVNYGYQEGFRAGLADGQDHWRYGYEDNYAYQARTMAMMATMYLQTNIITISARGFAVAMTMDTTAGISTVGTPTANTLSLARFWGPSSTCNRFNRMS
jgi:hypothetical protein